MNDSPLLKIEHDVRQLVGVLQYLVRSQAILRRQGGRLERGGGERGEKQKGRSNYQNFVN